MLRNFEEKNRLLSDYLCPADQRIQNFIDGYLGACSMDKRVKLPTNGITLERPGLARALSLPPDADSFHSDIVDSYRVKQGVLHNPKADRRTTQGRVPHRRRRPADPGGQKGHAQQRLRPLALARPAAPAPHHAAALHLNAKGSGRTLCVLAAQAGGGAGGAGIHARKTTRSAVLRPGAIW